MNLPKELEAKRDKLANEYAVPGEQYLLRSSHTCYVRGFNAGYIETEAREPVSYHACFSGDCDHHKEADCLKAIQSHVGSMEDSEAKLVEALKYYAGMESLIQMRDYLNNDSIGQLAREVLEEHRGE